MLSFSILLRDIYIYIHGFWINIQCLPILKLAQKYMKTDYGKYLKDVAEDVFGEE